MTLKRPTHDNPRVTLSLTRKQLAALYMACSELEIVSHEQLKLGYPFQPTQKGYIKMAVKRLRKYKVWDKIEQALEQADREVRS